ncbi:hypothetical protein ROHU_029161 [Labeo rohita]|uniref:Uncharacterized protein n=1 Tax=Labeo rohita TaxID=84645 RepID=A0A498M246_LABRO|nr:hypothetical protein ROHU_029161 [Labeo rohita]
MYNDTKAINPLTTRPDKLEYTTSEEAKNMEIEVKTSSAPIQEQSTHSTGMIGTIDSTAMAPFPNEQSSLELQKTTQLEDLQLVEQSTQQLQTTKQKITEPNQTTEHHIPDSTIFTINISSKAAEESSSITIREQTDHFTGINDTNNSTVMPSFPTDSLPDSQETTQSGDSQLAKKTQRLQTTIQKITEPSEVTEQHILDSTTFKIPSTAAEEPSTIAIHEQKDHLTGINDTNNSTAMPSFLTDSLPDSQETTHSGDPELVERFQTTKQKITEPDQAMEEHIPDSTTFKIPTIAAKETSTIAMHEQMDHFTGINDTNNSTAMASFPTHSSFPDSPETTLTEDSQQAEKSTQRLQTTRQKITESSEATEQHFPDFTTFTINVSSKAAEETSTIAMHEQMDHFTGINGINNSTAMASFPTQSSLPGSQETTHLADSQLAEESTQRLQTTIQNITESSEATEQHFPDFTTFTINISSKAAEETSSIAIHEQMDHFTGINDTNNSTAMASFPTDLLPDSQETTHAGELVERFQTTKAKITEPDQATEEQNPDSTTFKIPTIAAEETSIIAMHEQMDHFTGINDTNNSTAMASFPTHSSFPDSPETTLTEDSQQAEKSTQRLQTTRQKITESSEATEQHILDSTTFKIPSTAAEEPSTIAIHEQKDHLTGINDTNNSTAMPSFLTDSLPDSQETTHSGDPELVERFQTTKQKITEPDQAMEEHIPDSTTFKIPTIAAKETSTIAMHEQMDHFTGINDTNNSTAMASFPTHSSFPDSPETTLTEDSQQAEKSTQRLQTTRQKITESSEATEQHFPDFTTFTINVSSKAAEETSSIAIHEQMDHFTGINDTNNSTAMASFPTDLLPDSQETTHAGELVERFQTTKAKITEPDQATEEQNPDSTTFKIPTIEAEETSTIAMHEQMDHFTGINDTNNSTAMASFPTHSSFPDSQETTQTEDSQQAEKSTQRLQTTKQKITESSEATEQHFPDFTTFTINVSSKAAEEPSSITIDEQFNHFTNINGTNNSTAMASFPTDLLPDSQETTQSRYLQLAEEPTQHFQTTIQKIAEPSEVTEQHILYSTTFKIPSAAAEEPSSIAIHEQMDHFTGINDTNNSTAMASFPTQSSLPGSQETTHLGDSQQAEESTQRLQTTMQKITKPSEVTEQHIPDSTIFTINISSKAAEEPSPITIDEQFDHFTSINGTNNSTAMPSFPTDLLPDSQEITHAGELVERFQTTKEKITEPDQAIEEQNPDSTTFKIPTIAAEETSTIAIHEQMDHFTGINDTNNSTAMASFPTHSSFPDSQETTLTEDSQQAEKLTQRLQTAIQKITESSEATEQHFPDFTTFTINVSSKAAEEPSSITIDEQFNHFTGINDTNNSTAMASFPTQSSLPGSQETTHLGDSQLAEESTQRLQTAIQNITESSEATEHHIPDSTIFTINISSKAAEEHSSITIDEQFDHFTNINSTNNSTAMPSFPTDLLPDSQEITHAGELTEPDQAIEEQNPDSTTFKIPTIAEETSTIAIHEQMDHFTGINDTNNSTAMASFPTHSSFPDSQETTQTEDSQQAEESTQLLLTTKQKITEPSEVTDQHIPDSINGTNNSTAMPSFPTDLLPDSQEITNSGDPQLVKRFQTTKQKITEPDQAIEEKNPDSTTFKIPTITAKEPSTIAIHEQIDHFTGVNGTNNSTTMESFPTHSPLPDSQETTQSENSQLAEESTQRLQTTKLKIAEPSEVTDQHILDSTTFTIKISKAAEEPSSITIHEQIDNFTVINGHRLYYISPPCLSLFYVIIVIPERDPHRERRDLDFTAA